MAKIAASHVLPTHIGIRRIAAAKAWQYLWVLLMLLPLFATATAARAERIKDLAEIGGVRGNPLVGYGLVVGLNGTGDRTSQTPFTTQTLRNMLNELGVNLPAELNSQLKNVAAVVIHAELPPFSKPGQQIDVTVSSIGNSVSLRGGSLLMTPLKGIDGQIYAIAQGSLVVGGFGAEGKDGSRISVNVPSAGRIPNGAIVERALPDVFAGSTEVTINLHQPDFTTAARMTAVLNDSFGEGTAAALDGGTVRLATPTDAGARINFLSRVENLELSPGETAARIVVNSRTGTVVIGSAVRVMPAAVAHGSLTVMVSESTLVSQPEAFGEGNTAMVPESQISASSQGSHMLKFQGGVTLDQLIKAVNDIGAAPGDLIAILEALKQVGALQADLEVI